MNRTYYASVLLHGEKIKFWKVSPNKKEQVEDFYKDFMFAGENLRDFITNENFRVVYTQFVESEVITNDDIFDKLAPDWFKQWELIEGYKGIKPYNQEDK